MLYVLNIEKQQNESKYLIDGGAFELTSCKRFLYVAGDKQPELVEKLCSINQYTDNSTLYTGRDALKILLSVCCGLENKDRLGESEIFNVFKNTWKKFKANHRFSMSKISEIVHEIDYVLTETANIPTQCLNQIRSVSSLRPYGAIRDLLDFKPSDEISILIEPDSNSRTLVNVLAGVFSSTKHAPIALNIVFSDRTSAENIDVVLNTVANFQQKRSGAIIDYCTVYDFVNNPKPFVISLGCEIPCKRERSKILYLDERGTTLARDDIDVMTMDDLCKKAELIVRENAFLILSARELIDQAVQAFYKENPMCLEQRDASKIGIIKAANYSR